MIFDIFRKKEKAEDKYLVKMSYDRTKPATKRNVVKFLRNLGIEVKTNTKARGNNGIYLKNRIDVSRNLKEDKAVEVLIHEFAHHIHNKIEQNIAKNGGSLEILFKTNDTEEIKKELIKVTNVTDKDKRLEAFTNTKADISTKIKNLQKAIQKDYPDFQRSKKFSEFEKYIKHSDAKYLLKYDAIRLVTGWFIKKERIISVKNIEIDFPQMPAAFQFYIKLISLKRKQTKISRRINQLNKYYDKPAELFARFVQGYFSCNAAIIKLAPLTSQRFKTLLNSGYYKELKDFFEIFALKNI